MNEYWKRLWTEINLDNLLHNFGVVKSHLSNDTKICCVVKANAYGHHAPEIASVLESAGADMLAVSNIEEALQLRKSGIKIPVLILGYTPPECAVILSQYDITQCVYSIQYAKLLSNNLKDTNRSINVHIKVDTGMGRLGFCYDESMSAVEQIVEVSTLDNLKIEGIFTHFALSDSGENGRDFTLGQYAKLNCIINALEERGLHFKYKHCANSAATVAYPELQMNMVRAGLVLYGLYPSSDVSYTDAHLKPVMSLKSVISHIKEISAGDTVSYGCDFVADRKMKIATVPMGYADGFERTNAKNGVLLTVRQKKVPIVGRICMDQLMLDVTDIPDVSLGDEVVVFGYKENCNSVDDIAIANGTINYEIICSVGKRVPRVFIKNGKTHGIHLGLLDTSVN